eukprot:2472373-Alexandrium_andersonii.AAC.1
MGGSSRVEIKQTQALRALAWQRSVVQQSHAPLPTSGRHGSVIDVNAEPYSARRAAGAHSWAPWALGSGAGDSSVGIRCSGDGRQQQQWQC